MTLDEAIKHAEEVANSHDIIKQIKAVTLEECRCAEEHRQLAEWLKDYKQLKEQESCEDAVSRQTVLNYIYNDLGLGDEENGADIERQIELERSYEYIKSLPPVTPQQKYEDIAKAFQLGLAFGFGKKYNEMDKVIDEINYAAEISGVDRITVNGKVYLAEDKVFEIIDDVYAMWCYDKIDTVGEAIIELNKEVLALKEGEQE